MDMTNFAILELLTITIPLFISVFRLVDGFAVTHTTTVSGDVTVSMYGLSLASCARNCKCSIGCDHINYKRQLLLCELVRGTLHTNVNEIGSVTTSNMAQILRATYSEDCSVDTVRSCTEITTNQHTTVLGNMNVVGARRKIVCNGVYVIDGTETTTCTDQETWSDHGRCIKISTIRASCSTDTNCVDDDSECRGGICWCKPALSHDPATNSCVPVCPGAYADTFQALQDHRIKYFNIHEVIVGSMDECIALCLNYVHPTNPNYVCAILEFNTVTKYCNLNELPQGMLPSPNAIPGVVFLQRDCA